MTERNPFFGASISKVHKEELEKYPDLYSNLILMNKTPSDMVMHWMLKAMTVVFNNQEVNDDLFNSSTLLKFCKKHHKFHASISLFKDSLNQKNFYDIQNQDYLNQPVTVPSKLSFLKLPETILPSQFAKEITKLGEKFYPEQKDTEYTLMTQLGQYMEHRFDQRKRSIGAWVLIDSTKGIISRKDYKGYNQQQLLEQLTGFKAKDILNVQNRNPSLDL